MKQQRALNMEKIAGPVMLDLIAKEVSPEEKELLQHPLVGGVILFTRNYENPEQLKQLCKTIRSSRKIPLLITVDQEGGRVQRFREGFTRIPSMGEIGQLFLTEPDVAEKLAETSGWQMATELRAVGIDLSFAPVLDLNKGLNAVVGDRAFYSKPNVVILLAKAFIRGMKKAGMVATAKHFPGHGSVAVDSHLEMPIDTRSYADIHRDDMQPFIELIEMGIEAMMPAHILFPAVDTKPVGFSAVWLQEILRKKLQFSGTIFSDDLNMKGAEFAGDYVSRAQSALDAGCDVALICNNRLGAIQILDQLSQKYIKKDNKLNLLLGR